VTAPHIVYQDDSTTLICGTWQDALAAGMVPRVDAVITDPPYGARTHVGHDGAAENGRAARMKDPGKLSRTINYAAWSNEQAADAAQQWSAVAAGWVVVMSDHELARAWEASLEASGRYVFAPIPFVAPGSRIRLAGDGPSSWTVWLTVARPKTREMQHWGTLQGAYVLPQGCADKSFVGGKPPWLMRELIDDYSRPGDLILDPCCGSGTTAIAARDMGRRCITIEMDPATCELARKRIVKHAAQPPLFRPDGLDHATQEGLGL
jgi:site-specific DNA-methyltransferase (adenine-specific)